MDGDDGQELERVGRRTTPALWIGGWLAGLAVIVGLAIAGSPPVVPTDEPGPAVALASVATVSPSPATPSAHAPLVIRHPLPSRPPLGEDGLIGGIVFGTSWAPD
jgi:hypothetical protein